MRHRLAFALLIAANVIWGSSYVVAKVALEELPSVLLAALRFTVATAILWPVLFWQARRNHANGKVGLEPVAPADRLTLFGFGWLAIAFGYNLAYWGVSLTTATDASLMIIAEVAFTSLLAAWWVKDPITRPKQIGIIVGGIGVTILVLGNATSAPAGTNGLSRAWGDILVLGALLCQAIYTVLGAKLAHKYQPTTILANVYLGSMVVWVPVLIWYSLNGLFPALSLAAMLGVGFLGLFAAVLSNVLWFRILPIIGPGRASISLFVQPFVGALMGLIVLGEPLTVSLMVGGVLIFSALYLTTL